MDEVTLRPLLQPMIAAAPLEKDGLEGVAEVGGSCVEVRMIWRVFHNCRRVSHADVTVVELACM
jgi:hypothetical protein